MLQTASDSASELGRPMARHQRVLLSLLVQRKMNRQTVQGHEGVSNVVGARTGGAECGQQARGRDRPKEGRGALARAMRHHPSFVLVFQQRGGSS